MNKIIKIILLFIPVLFISCIQENQGAYVKKILLLDGSTSIGPVAETLAKAYMDLNPDITVRVQQSGSGAGIRAVIDGTCDIGMSSRNLNNSEILHGLNKFKIATDAILVVVNSKNPLDSLSEQQLAMIYKGNISNWSELDSGNGEIIVISRESGSGTRKAFEDNLKLFENNFSLAEKATEIFCNANNEVLQNVISKPRAIGYISAGYSLAGLTGKNIKILKINGIMPDMEKVKSGEYSIKRDFLLITKIEINKEAKEFIDFILSDEGQDIIKSENFAGV